MNDQPSTPGFDELLSAYLDDELSADERAQVEIRLAADPAARQLLEQLRHISHSVRDLPNEVAGHRLHDAILHRIETARASRNEPAEGVAPNPQPPAPSPQPPSISIGRTPRAWFWASMAIAAALLIMFMRPGDEANNNLPQVATSETAGQRESLRRSRELTESEMPPNEGAQPQFGADKTDAFAARLPESGAPIPPAEASGEAIAPRDGDAAPAEPMNLAGQPVSPSPSASPLGRARPQSTELGSRSESAPPSVGANSSLEITRSTTPPPPSPPPQGERVIVNLVATPDAIENRTFDEVLRKHGVEIESPAPVEGAAAAAERQQQITARSSGVREESAAADTSSLDTAEAAKQSPPAEVVLVEAPPKAILSCMEELSVDNKNFAAISVDRLWFNGSSPIGGVKSGNEPLPDTTAAKLEKYQRGFVPKAPDEGGLSTYHFYDSSGTQPLLYGADRAGGFGGGFSVAELKDRSMDADAESNFERGTARRLKSPETRSRAYEGRQPTLSASGAAQPAASQPAQATAPMSVDDNAAAPASSSSAVRKAAPASDERMQVLFVIRPGQDAATPLKAKNSAE